MEKGGKNSAGIVMSSSTGGQGREGALVSVEGEGLLPDVACLRIQREPHV